MPKVLQPTPRMTNVDMTQSYVSLVVDGRYLEQIKWQIVWTGTPVGSFSLQESLDFNPAVPASGTWLDNGASITSPSGSAGSSFVNLLDRAPCFYRLVWTPTTPGSNAGTLNVYASGAGPK